MKMQHSIATRFNGKSYSPASALSACAVLAMVCMPISVNAQTLITEFERPVGVIFERPASLTRDERFNRVVNRSPSLASGGVDGSGGLGGGFAIGNMVSVTQSGSGNTLVLTVDQNNSGNVSATQVLNGTLGQPPAQPVTPPPADGVTLPGAQAPAQTLLVRANEDAVNGNGVLNGKLRLD